MESYNVFCRKCNSKFNSNDFGEICPNCSSTEICGISEFFNAMSNNSEKSTEEPKDCVIYYINSGMFRVMHKDSHFYTHSQNLNELRNSNSNIRYYTKSSAEKAIAKMREKSPEWNLKIMSI